MKESRIIKSIKYHVVERLLNDECWQVDELFARASAIIFPFLDQIEYDNNLLKQPGSIQRLVEELAKFCKQKQLSNFSFDGLVDFFRMELCSNRSLNIKKNCLKEAISLIDSFSEEGFISWKGNAKVYNTIVGNFKDDARLHKYGDKSYVATDEFENIKNKICNLYDRMVVSRGGEDAVKDFEYIWQWLISPDEYNDISKILKDNRDVISMGLDKLLNDQKCVWIIVAYIAEQYKREWEGNDGEGNDGEDNDGEDNAIEQVGLQPRDREKIAIGYFGKNSSKIFKHSNEDRREKTEWLRSLQMEGGLPIRYIVCSEELDDFITNIYDDQMAIESLERTPNKTRIYSYREGFSIYKYVEALRGEGAVYSQGDAEQELFKKFQKILKEGRSPNSRRNASKFSIEYMVWRWDYSDEFAIHRQVSLKRAKEYNEEQEIISVDRIRNVWQIEEPTYVFWLRIEGKDWNRDYEFYRQGDSYCSATGRMDFPTPDVCLSSSDSMVVKITYVPQGTDGQKEENESRWIDISKDIATHQKDYILFSSKDGNRWYQGRFGNKGGYFNT